MNLEAFDWVVITILLVLVLSKVIPRLRFGHKQRRAVKDEEVLDDKN